MSDEKDEEKSGENSKSKNKYCPPSLVVQPAQTSKRVQPIMQGVNQLVVGVASFISPGPASGSATGNPRNKVALQPGHSLMDWVRLGSSGRVDLAGVGSQAGHLRVPSSILAMHAQPHDAWLAIRGRVYNVTHYLPFHPGGIEELMRGVGTDATRLFDQVHAWVNYESLLQKCYVGPLVAMETDIDVTELFSSKKEIPKITKSLASPTSSAANDISFKVPETASTIPENTIPKFDWIQQTDSLTFIFYLKPFANPWINIVKEDTTLKINITYDNQTYINEFYLAYPLKWPCKTSVNNETGKCEIIFDKNEPKIWPTYGGIKQSKVELLPGYHDNKNEYIIVGRIQVTYNTYLIIMRQFDVEVMNVIPIGFHIKICIEIKDQEHSRSYTPVHPALIKKYEALSYSMDSLCLMVKTYPQGIVSPTLVSTSVGGNIDISPPIGGFNLSDLELRDRILLIAAGTGLTPMIGVLKFALDRRIRRCQKLKLLFFNRTENDILWKDQFQELALEDKRFSIENILSEPDTEWKGRKGRVDKKILHSSLDELLTTESDIKTDVSSLYVCICGPGEFTHLVDKMLLEVSPDRILLQPNQIHCFLG